MLCIHLWYSRQTLYYELLLLVKNAYAVLAFYLSMSFNEGLEKLGFIGLFNSSAEFVPMTSLNSN